MNPLTLKKSRWPEGSVGAESEHLRRRLGQAGIEGAASDAAALLCWALDCDRSYLASRGEEALPPEAKARLSEAASRRVRREPLAYILGEREFWSLPFGAEPSGLIPRPETELLVERAAALLSGAAAPRILDLGTGSGAIGVALAKELPGARVVAVDSSGPALELAVRNALRNGVEDRFEPVCSDLFEKIPGDESFDAVVSNPPYIVSSEIGGLMPEVARYEPREALDGGPDGMRFLRRIVHEAPARLKRGGILLMEMDPAQISWCVAEVRLTRAHGEPMVRRDLAGRDRVIESETV